MPKAAAATFDDDFGTFEPRRGAAPRKPAAGSKAAAARRSAGGKGRKGRTGKRFDRFGLDMAKVARVAAIGMGASIAGAIMVNALMMQKSRHPAPLFGQTIAMPKQVAPKPVAAPAASPVKPAPFAPVVMAPSPVPPVAPPANAKPHQAAGASEKATGDDAIARLLGDGGKFAKPEVKAEAKPDGKTVLNVQRALAKLGFAVTPNGSLGPQTRHAIEAFEKDRHLAVNGAVSPRLVKVLSAESGVKVD